MKLTKLSLMALLMSSPAAFADEVPTPEPTPEPEPVCETVGPLEDQLFVRGGFNFWSEDLPLCFDAESGSYKAELEVLGFETTHFKLATADWSSFICSIDSKYPSTDVDVLFSEEAAQPLALGEASVMDCYNEAERLESEDLELVFTGMKFAFEVGETYTFEVKQNEELLWEITVSQVEEEPEIEVPPLPEPEL